MTQSTSIAPMLAFKGTAAAIEFYKKAFGAAQLFRRPPRMTPLFMPKSKSAIR